jgi:peptide/nickel transport system permease protein
MLHDAYPYLELNPWQTFVPGVCIFLAVLSCNFIGDGLRDLLDPRERASRGACTRAHEAIVLESTTSFG